MVTVGITGGIGSGKSTVCQVWAGLGAFVLNADDLAKEVMVTHPEVKKELIQTFGDNSFYGDGTLNREFLAREAFEKGRVQQLNAIVHPRLPDATKRKIDEAREAGCDVFIYEAALLLDSLSLDSLDYIVLVLADVEHRIERVKERDEQSEKQIRQRIEKQRDFEQAVDRVDYVIRNNGTLKELKKKAEVIYENFLPFSGKNEKKSRKK